MLHEGFETLGHHGSGQVEAVDLALVDPRGQLVSHLSAIAYDGCVATAECKLGQKLSLGQLPVAGKAGGRLDGVRAAISDGFVELVSGKVDPGAGRKMRQSRLGAGIGEVIRVPLTRERLRFVGNDADTDEYLHVVRMPAGVRYCGA